jgi:16S rRNA (guanine1207-N2)-methyltransferase
VKARHPACRVTLADASAFALAAAARTFSINGFTAEAILPTDVFSDIEGRFDWIISNPPFHHGIGTNYDIVSAFIAQAPEHLHPGGTLLLVANHFLRYEPLMERSLAAPLRVAEDGAYKILLSRKP